MANGQIRLGSVVTGEASVSSTAQFTLAQYAVTSYERGLLTLNVMAADAATESFLGWTYMIAYTFDGTTLNTYNQTAIYTVTVGADLGAPSVVFSASGTDLLVRVTPANTRAQRWCAEIRVASIEEDYSGT